MGLSIGIIISPVSSSILGEYVPPEVPDALNPDNTQMKNPDGTNAVNPGS